MFASILLSLKKRFSKDGKYYGIVEKLLGIYPNNIELYKLALIHRSATQFLDDGTPVNNERLEFLGDAILESIISDYLFVEYPDRNEGFLSKVRSKIVSRATLNELGASIGLDRYLVVQHSRRHVQKHIYGDALEAMVGAVYLDKGYDFVNRLVINVILRNNLNLKEIIESESDFKSRLIELAQKKRCDVVFDTDVAGSDGDQQFFRTEVRLSGRVAGTGTGRSKKEAEQMASQEILESGYMDEDAFSSGAEVS